MSHAIDNVFSEQMPQDRVLRVTPFQREFAAVTLWIIVTFVQFSGDQLLLYPLALYFAVRAVQERARILALMLRAWPILLFPLWCLISPIWAVEPFEAFKQAVYLTLTMVVCFHIALHLNIRQIMLAILTATGTIALLTFILGLPSGNFAWALFPHKNRMGISMMMLWTVAVAIALDSGAERRTRLVAVPFALLALFLVLMSDSATAILLAAASLLICLTATSTLLGGFLRPSRMALTCLVLALIAAVGSIGVSTYKGDPVAVVLDHFGKDRTLTGRTVLWEYAEDQIEERPILGVGSGGFWRYQVSPVVQRIYEEFHKRPWDHFNFHNSYYEVAVHQGLIGLGIVMLAIIWSSTWICRAAFSVANMPHIYFLCVACTVLVRTFTEADFYKHFIIFHMLFWIGTLAAIRTMRR